MHSFLHVHGIEREVNEMNGRESLQPYATDPKRRAERDVKGAESVCECGAASRKAEIAREGRARALTLVPTSDSVDDAARGELQTPQADLSGSSIIAVLNVVRKSEVHLLAHSVQNSGIIGGP